MHSSSGNPSSDCPELKLPGTSSPLTARALGASLGAFHAANTLFKHPDKLKRCYALSGVYDMRNSMDIRLVTRCGPWESARPDLPNVRRAREPWDCTSSRRLGPKGRTRMALLASPDVGIRGRALLRNLSAGLACARSQRCDRMKSLAECPWY